MGRLRHPVPGHWNRWRGGWVPRIAHLTTIIADGVRTAPGKVPTEDGAPTAIGEASTEVGMVRTELSTVSLPSVAKTPSVGLRVIQIGEPALHKVRLIEASLAHFINSLARISQDRRQGADHLAREDKVNV